MESHLDFSAFIADRTREFTGRDWVCAEIDRWLTHANGVSCFAAPKEPLCLS